VYLWDAATRRFTASLIGPVEDGAFSVAFGPGDTLAAGHFDGSTYLWNVATRAVTGTISGGGGSVYSVAFGSGSALLVTRTQQGVVKLWKVVRHKS
jgi:WD40 repeat protein